jgi:nitrile hydratase
LPPTWYKAAPYRSRTVIDPRGVLKELGLDIPADKEVRVWDSTAEVRYMVLPERPSGTDGWTEAQLMELITRDSMIGTGSPKSPNVTY